MASATAFPATWMFRSLHLKFLFLLFGVALVALSGTLILRQLMLRDFADYEEGDAEDRAYAVLADFEGTYERDSGWNEDSQSRLALSILALGFEARLLDEEGRVVATSRNAVEEASPAFKRRLGALAQLVGSESGGAFTPYPLFLAGKQIGTLELRLLRPTKESLLLTRADRFFLLSLVMVGGVALMMSLFFSHRLTRPIKQLALAASAISGGDLRRRVSVSRRDEVGELAAAFNRMADTLEAQEELRRKLIADVAHELRTPLSVMRGEIEAIMDGLIPNDEKRLESLYEETGRLKRMVEAVEDLNQAEASSLTLKPERIPLKAFLDGIVVRFGPVFERKGVNLGLSCPDGAVIKADPERLSQIVINLLNNALRATDTGGSVSVAFVERDGEPSITVTDSGKGMSAKDLPLVFERFYRGPGGGLGIGLTIVKELVEAHGGRVEVTSAEGRGTSFTVLIPDRSLHNSS